MDHVHIAPGGDKDGAQRGFGHAEHGVQHHLQPPGTDGVHVHRADDGVNIGVHGVHDLDLAGADALLIGDRGTGPVGQGRDILLDAGGNPLVGVPSPLGEHLHAVIQRRVVAGGDRHAVGQFVIAHGEHHQGGGGLPLHHHAGHARPGHHLGGPVGGLLGEEPPVVARQKSPLGHPLVLHFPGQGVCQALDIGLGEAVPDDSPPAAGSKFDAHSI